MSRRARGCVARAGSQSARDRAEQYERERESRNTTQHSTHLGQLVELLRGSLPRLGRLRGLPGQPSGRRQLRCALEGALERLVRLRHLFLTGTRKQFAVTHAALFPAQRGWRELTRAGWGPHRRESVQLAGLGDEGGAGVSGFRRAAWAGLGGLPSFRRQCRRRVHSAPRRAPRAEEAPRRRLAGWQHCMEVGCLQQERGVGSRLNSRRGVCWATHATRRRPVPTRDYALLTCIQLRRNLADPRAVCM